MAKAPRKAPVKDLSIERSFATLSTAISVLTRRVEAIEQKLAEIEEVAAQPQPAPKKSLFMHLFGGL
jgi:hypothetical protein